MTILKATLRAQWAVALVVAACTQADSGQNLRDATLFVRFGVTRFDQRERTDDAWTRDANGAVSEGWRSRRGVASRVGSHSDDAWVSGIAGTDDTLTLTAEGIASSPLELDGDRAMFRDVFASTDMMVVARSTHAELFYLLRGSDSPRTYRWRASVGGGLVEPRDEEGGLVFADHRGHGVLRIPRAYAIDARGTKRAARLRWDAGVLSVSLDTEGLAFPILLDPGVETVAWEQVDDGLGNRYEPALAFDSARGIVVEFGGYRDGIPFRADTYEWNGTSWSKRVTAHAPAARRGAKMVFDTVRKRVLLFGGEGVVGNNWGEFDDTWEYDGIDWLQRQPAHRPPARSVHAMAFDTVRGRAVVYGGWQTGHSPISTTPGSGTAMTGRT